MSKDYLEELQYVGDQFALTPELVGAKDGGLER
jgi:hypothetical protein